MLWFWSLNKGCAGESAGADPPEPMHLDILEQQQDAQKARQEAQYGRGLRNSRLVSCSRKSTDCKLARLGPPLS